MPLCVHGDAEDAAGIGACAMERGHAVLEQNLHAGLLGRGFAADASARCRRKWWPAPRDRRACRSAPSASPSTAACISRGTELPTDVAAARVGRLVDEDDAMRDQEIEGGGAIVGKGADDLAVVVAVVGKAIGLDHRPIGEIAEDEIGRILDAVFLLRAGAAAERNVAAAADGVAADMLLRLDDDHRRAGLARDDRRREAHGAGADHHDVCLPAPSGRGMRGPGRGKAWRGETAGGHRRARNHNLSEEAPP